MPIPRIAIVGRPNVGKSSLLNMLARSKVSIVDPVPGVTRDRVSHVCEIEGEDTGGGGRTKLVEITDTGGYGVYVAEGGRFDDAGEDLTKLTGQIEGQIAAAVDRADLILFVFDAQAGVTPMDEVISKMLRERALGGKGRVKIPVQVVANKVDADKWEAYAVEASRLGFGEPWMVGARNNFRRRDFFERLFAALPEQTREDRRQISAEIKIAIVGKRNAGKSSFVNALAGEERCIVSEIAGTTRDAIDVRFELDGKVCIAIDTAGVRKTTKMRERVEHWAHDRAMMSVRRSDVCLLMLDATQEISGIDKRLGATVLEEYKPCIIVVNKWDLVEGKVGRKGVVVTVEDYLEYIGKELRGMTHCPIVFTSANEGTGVVETVELAFELAAQARKRISTSKLNDIVRNILKLRGPSTKLGSRVKVLYVSQVEIAPPTIVLVVNHPDFFTSEYERYMLNRLREETDFKEVPIRLIVRERKRAELDDLLSGRHQQRRAASGAGGVGVGVAGEGTEGFGADDDILADEMLAEDDLPESAEGFEMEMEGDEDGDESSEP
jgi:GTP-binding protein